MPPVAPHQKDIVIIMTAVTLDKTFAPALATTPHHLHATVLITSGDNAQWVTFTAESPKWLDRRIAEYLQTYPMLSIDLTASDVNWGQLPHTFQLVLSR